MTIPEMIFPYINIGLLVIAVLAIIDGYMHGFMLMLLNLISLAAALFLAWALSPAIAAVVPIYPKSATPIEGPVGDLIYTKFNAGLWFIVIFIVVMILSVVLRPLVKAVGKVPVIKQTNKILGAAFSLVLTAFWLMVLTFVLTTPLFTNGKEAIEASWLKPFSDQRNPVFGFASDRLNESVMVQRIISGQPMTAGELEEIRNWLEEHNIDADAIDDFIQSLK